MCGETGGVYDPCVFSSDTHEAPEETAEEREARRRAKWEQEEKERADARGEANRGSVGCSAMLCATSDLLGGHAADGRFGSSSD